MKKLQVLGLGLIVAMGLNGCIEKKENKDKEQSLKAWEKLQKEIKQLNNETLKEKDEKPKTEAQKNFDEYWEKKVEAGKNSKVYKLLDINNN